MKLGFYPGCSLESTSVAYDLSVQAVCKELEIELSVVDDWNCCGATETATLDQLSAYALVARNLARTDAGVDELVAPCASCYLNLYKTDKIMRTHPGYRDKISQALAAGGLAYEPGRLRVRHLLSVIYEDFGQQALEAKVTAPLQGLRVAAYTGCQVVRPGDATDDTEHPVQLDEVMRWLGCTVVDYPLRTHCCGGHMSQLSEGQSNELIRRLMHTADDAHADVIACLCPMCQLNLDAYQGRVNNAFNTDFATPVLFFTQLIGLAMGIAPKTLGLGKEIIAAKPVIDKRLAEPAGASKPRRGRRNSSELPMPGPK